jgi:hypothetical protein
LLQELPQFLSGKRQWKIWRNWIKRHGKICPRFLRRFGLVQLIVLTHNATCRGIICVRLLIRLFWNIGTSL